MIIQVLTPAATPVLVEINADTPAASAVSFNPTGSIAATNVQAAISELDGELDATLRPSDNRLWRFHGAIMVNGYTNPRIALIGDSMIGTSRPGTLPIIESTFGISGYGFLDGGHSAGASIEYDACVKWITGETFLLPTSGIVTFGLNGSVSIEADTIKVYYLRQSGGGTFKIQTSANGAAWTDESGYTSVNTAGATAGVVISISKAAYKTKYMVRCVGVSGSCNIIGAGMYHTSINGAVVSYITNSSSGINNIDNASLTSRAITDPIFADIGCNLIILSNLDGAGGITFQATFQNNINAAFSTLPSWLIIGPPCGYDAPGDELNKAQAAAQSSLALSRGDAFYDNRKWALPFANAVANGLLNPGDPHYTERAYKHWPSEMFREMGLTNTAATNGGKQNVFALRRGGYFRDIAAAGSSYNPSGEFVGALTVSNPAGETGFARISLSPTDVVSPSSSDLMNFVYVGGQFLIAHPDGSYFALKNNAGQNELCCSGGIHSHLGRAANRWGHLWLEKNVVATTGNKTVARGTPHGTVRFAAGSSTPIVVTHPDATTTGTVICQVYGTDTTLSSVRVTKAAGAFTITPNSTATFETEIGWFLLE